MAEIRYTRNNEKKEYVEITVEDEDVYKAWSVIQGMIEEENRIENPWYGIGIENG